jgi:hypothetical protein
VTAHGEGADHGCRRRCGNRDVCATRLTCVHVAAVYAWEMLVDIETEIEIDRPRGEVAAYVSDPDNATSWYENIKAIEWESPKPVAVGSRVAFAAQFLGRRLAYTYEVKLIVPSESGS